MDLPEDRRAWSPLNKGRTALDQMAECAVTNNATAVLLESCVNAWNPQAGSFDQTDELTAAIRAIPADLPTWDRLKAELGDGTGQLVAAFRASAEKLTTAIRKLPTEAFDAEVDLGWGKLTLTQIVHYPQWNICYHQGQINYISTLL